MSDTQWPRYQVFERSKADQPHQSAGTVHAADAEMALNTARDLFVRRPSCAGLWVARADAIRAMTADEVEAFQTDGEQNASSEPYHVFCKSKPRGSFVYAGQVEAVSAAAAMAGLAGQAVGPKALGWWAVPARAVTASRDEDYESMFEPAEDKRFRLMSDYPVDAMMRELREADKEREGRE